jgi:hypothetical protein
MAKTQSKPDTTPLGRSSIEFMVGALISIACATIPMNWWLVLVLYVFIATIAVDVVFHSKPTIALAVYKKLLLCVTALIFIASLAYKPVAAMYKAENVIPPELQYVEKWGTDYQNVVTASIPARLVSGPGNLEMDINGSSLIKYKDRFNLVGVVSHFSAKSGSYMAQADICKSSPYGITNERMTISIPLCQSYLNEIVAGARVDNFILVAIPLGSKAGEFETLDDALERGAQIIAKKSAAGARPTFSQ